MSTMTQTPAGGTFLFLTKRKARVDPSEVQNVFDLLPAVSPEFIFGEWEAHLLATGHPSDPKAAALLPIFKVFRSRTSVDKYSLAGGEKKHLPGWGNLFLAEMTYRGISSAAMIYGDCPVVDYLRYVDDNTIAGAQWSLNQDDSGVLYFYLTRK
ncbi:hypothetical protein BO79DRAFT_252887 [Aspergillus costaricaensis CBS 115574]|uniref:Uncharacterized protein n=1 Tax=Aspergillus costaricaensis CBS 115574 TaxID=1448317 RepID=A0ACD1IJB5_9EURO|nr:hypothetical protein BO79DRAFT_252887 [Aspergillus costaricaensis CBS 115574]RAK90705.1 hypothetical protein BO79DRAFT_252887 [Aspergillus costaricaensis CBS 115574]